MYNFLLIIRPFLGPPAEAAEHPVRARQVQEGTYQCKAREDRVKPKARLPRVSRRNR